MEETEVEPRMELVGGNVTVMAIKETASPPCAATVQYGIQPELQDGPIMVGVCSLAIGNSASRVIPARNV